MRQSNIAQMNRSARRHVNPRSNHIEGMGMASHQRGQPVDAEVPHQDFETFMRAHEKASNAYITGNVEPLLAVSTERDPASFLPQAAIVLSAPTRSTRQTRRALPSSQRAARVILRSWRQAPTAISATGRASSTTKPCEGQGQTHTDAAAGDRGLSPGRWRVEPRPSSRGHLP